MAGSEKQCAWHFDIQTGEDEGPNDALGQNFKGNPYSALVRESIQNSLDVPISKNAPVRVCYSFGTIDSNRFPNFFELKEHIKGCMDFWNQKTDIVNKYQKKLDYFEASFIETMPYLKISDYNTTGMDYKKDGNNEPFYAFVRASKISIKGGEYQGGTYGFGKAAYFQLSPINTLFVSTMTKDGRCYFEGKSVLCTHLFEGEKKTAVGFYDSNDGKYPIEEIDNIPKRFRRDTPGTDFFILGFQPERIDKAIAEMKEEILRSFFAAIYFGRLIVEIEPISGEKVIVCKETLSSCMKDVFNSDNDSSGQFRTLNPKPYYDAIMNCGNGKKFEIIKGNKPLLGDVRMYVKKDADAPDRIIYMRRPLMSVFSQKSTSSLGFYGVFICEDKRGDDILSKLENSSHSRWSTDFYRDDITNEVMPDGKLAMAELNEFRDECLAKLAGQTTKNELTIAGLEDLLYVPESLIEEDEDAASKVIGNPSGTAAEESGSITTTSGDLLINSQLPTETNQLGTIIIESIGKATSNEIGNDNVGSGHNNGHKGNGDNLPPGPDIQKATIDCNSGKHFCPMNVPIRTFAQVENGVIYHYIVIHSDRNVENGTIELIVCGEQYDMAVTIVETNNGYANNNIISNLQFGAETVRIKVRFADNQKHSILTKLYYEE